MVPADSERAAETARVLQGIIQLAGGRFVKKTNLFKAFYWAHRFYWREHEGVLTKRPGVVHMPQGPGIDEGDEIIAWMEGEGLIRVDVPRAEYESHVFHLLAPVELTEAELSAIRKAVRKVNGRRAVDVSEESHKESRSWVEGENGDRLDIYYDEIDSSTLHDLDEGLTRVKTLVDDVFGPDPWRSGG